MVLKRKRSDSEISSSSSLLSSPLSANYMSIDMINQPQIQPPSLFSARTRKRHRDNRPSESAVHQHTLSLLFSAQQNPQIQSPPPPQFSSQTTAPVSSIPDHHSSQQSSLHSFWALPSTRQGSPSSTFSTASQVTTPDNSYYRSANCEDCNTCLSQSDNGDSMDVDMMMDIDSQEMNFGCSRCGKQVCHSCAVSNMGADRKCLNCAKPANSWAGSNEGTSRGRGILISDFGRRNGM